MAIIESVADNSGVPASRVPITGTPRSPSMVPLKGVDRDAYSMPSSEVEQKTASSGSTIIEQENGKLNEMENSVADQKLEDMKGVKGVDTVV